jgi:hypothetical protein
LGFIFFLNYKGTIIPVKELWFVLSIFTMVAGAYFLAKHKLQNQNGPGAGNDSLAHITQLKHTGDKVRVTLEHAKVLTRSYRREIISEGLPSKTEMLDALYDSNRNYKTEEVQQTYIVFQKQFGDKVYQFVSPATTLSSEAVKGYMDRHKGVDLYIDPQNPERYYFELPFA